MTIGEIPSPNKKTNNVLMNIDLNYTLFLEYFSSSSAATRLDASWTCANIFLLADKCLVSPLPQSKNESKQPFIGAHFKSYIRVLDKVSKELSRV